MYKRDQSSLREGENDNVANVLIAFSPESGMQKILCSNLPARLGGHEGDLADLC